MSFRPAAALLRRALAQFVGRAPAVGAYRGGAPSNAARLWSRRTCSFAGPASEALGARHGYRSSTGTGHLSPGTPPVTPSQAPNWVPAACSEADLLRLITADEEARDFQVRDAHRWKVSAISDEQGKVTISMEPREYPWGETVAVDMSCHDLTTLEEDGDNGGVRVDLEVRASMGNRSLRFQCGVAWDELCIESVSVDNDAVGDCGACSYPGSYFGDLDEDLQEAFYKYLANRGITPGIVEKLFEYLIDRGKRSYTKWLNEVMDYVVKK